MCQLCRDTGSDGECRDVPWSLQGECYREEGAVVAIVKLVEVGIAALILVVCLQAEPLQDLVPDADARAIEVVPTLLHATVVRVQRRDLVVVQPKGHPGQNQDLR